VPVREDLATPESWSKPISTRGAIEEMPEGCIAVADAMGITTAGIFGDILTMRMVRRGVAALVTAFPGSGQNATVPVILEIDGTDLMKDLKGNTAAAEVYIYAFDSEGLVRDRVYQKIALDLKKVSDKLRATGIKYYATLILAPGTYAVKTLVRIPETDRKGFVRAELVVPKRGETAILPPIFIEDTPRWVMIKDNSHAAGAADPFELGGEHFIPAVTARVKSGEAKRFAVFVFNAAPNEVTFDTIPKVKFLGAAKSGATSTALVMEVTDSAQPTLDVTVKAKGATDSQKVLIQ